MLPSQGQNRLKSTKGGQVPPGMRAMSAPVQAPPRNPLPKGAPPVPQTVPQAQAQPDYRKDAVSALQQKFGARAAPGPEPRAQPKASNFGGGGGTPWGGNGSAPPPKAYGGLYVPPEMDTEPNYENPYGGQPENAGGMPRAAPKYEPLIPTSPRTNKDPYPGPGDPGGMDRSGPHPKQEVDWRSAWMAAEADKAIPGMSQDEWEQLTPEEKEALWDIWEDQHPGSKPKPKTVAEDPTSGNDGSPLGEDDSGSTEWGDVSGAGTPQEAIDQAILNLLQGKGTYGLSEEELAGQQNEIWKAASQAKSNESQALAARGFGASGVGAANLGNIDSQAVGAISDLNVKAKQLAIEDRLNALKALGGIYGQSASEENRMDIFEQQLGLETDKFKDSQDQQDEADAWTALSNIISGTDGGKYTPEAMAKALAALQSGKSPSEVLAMLKVQGEGETGSIHVAEGDEAGPPTPQKGPTKYPHPPPGLNVTQEQWDQFGEDYKASWWNNP